jgi:hypothetical protein
MWLVSAYVFWFVEVKLLEEKFRRYIGVPLVQADGLYPGGVIRDDTDEAIFSVEPTEDTNVLSFEFPDAVDGNSRKRLEPPVKSQAITGAEDLG